MTPQLRTYATRRSRYARRAWQALATTLLCGSLLAPTAHAIDPVPIPEEEPGDVLTLVCLRDTQLRSFTATPQSISPPATSTTLQWQVQVPNFCQGWQLLLSGQVVAAAGSRVMTPPVGGATYTLTAKMNGQTKSLGSKTVNTWQCNPPVIGWEAGGFEPFLTIKPHTITVQYHDQCTAEDWTKVYGRQGLSGAFTLLKQDGTNSGGWRTVVHNNLLPETTYCYKVQTSKAGVVKESPVRCQTTPKPACSPPVIGWEAGGKEPFVDSTPTSLTVHYHDQCGNDVATKVYARKSTTSSWTLIRSDGPNSADWRTATYHGLSPNTEYCFQVVTTGPDSFPSASVPRCTTTPVGFMQPELTANEAQQVFQTFAWEHTSSLTTGPAAQPSLYYMNVLVEKAPAVQALQALGVHVQASPLFPEELHTWQEQSSLVTQQGVVTGRWYFAVMPATIYNTIRTETLKGLATGDTPAFPAVVMRTIPVAAARDGGHLYRLSYQYLGEQGLEYNGATSQSHDDCVTLPDGTVNCDLGQKRQELLGSLGRWLLTYVDGAFDLVVEQVREGIGFFTRKVKGEINLPLTFKLYNTDPLFFDSSDTIMMSGWRGQELALAGVKVQVRQGLALFSGTTDAAGQVTLKVAKNISTQVCVEAENRYARLTEFLDTVLVCFPGLGSFGSSPTTSQEIKVKHTTLQVLAQLADAAEYVRTRMHHDMEKITVLVGKWADRVSILGGHAFAPCMGRTPNLALGLSAEAASTALFGSPLVGSFAEFLFAVDIIMPTADLVSRSVGVHEYGHAVMCSLLARQGFFTLQTAWTDLIFASASVEADNETRYVAEGFADFLAAQVGGGTNYFVPSFPLAAGVSCNTAATDPHWRWSENVHYCVATPCLEGDSGDNYHEDHRHCMDSVAPAFQAQVRRVASLLHDAFDGHTGPTAMNTGIHWEPSSSNTYLVHKLIPMGADDDPISMAAPCVAELFEHWDRRGNLLSEHTFLGALADTLRADGYDESEICDLFKKHSATDTCPAYAQNSSVSPGNGCSSHSGSGGSGNGGIGSGTGNNPDDPPLSQN
jgi:hypothetical protein